MITFLRLTGVRCYNEIMITVLRTYTDIYGNCLKAIVNELMITVLEFSNYIIISVVRNNKGNYDNCFKDL